MDTASTQPRPFSIGKIISLAIATAFVIGSGVLAKDYLAKQSDLTVLANKACVLEQNDCDVQLGTETIKLRFQSPSSRITSGQELTAIVESSPSNTPTTISLQGRDMYMGENHFSLSQTAPSVFSQQVQFPVCTTGKMAWQALITYDDGNAVIFEFEVE